MLSGNTLFAECEKEILIFVVIIDLDSLSVHGTGEVLVGPAVMALEIYPVDLHPDGAVFQGVEKRHLGTVDHPDNPAAVVMDVDVYVDLIELPGHFHNLVFRLVNERRIAFFVDQAAGDIRYADSRISFHASSLTLFPQKGF